MRMSDERGVDVTRMHVALPSLGCVIILGCARVWAFGDLRLADAGAEDGFSARDGGVMACSWSILDACPPPPQQSQGPCVPGSDVPDADTCNSCLTVTCGDTWNCCGSDPTQVTQGQATYPACLVLAQCVLSDVAQGQNYATALPACESAGSYSPQSESAGEALMACITSQCTSACNLN
jgi:hypothetical protein